MIFGWIRNPASKEGPSLSEQLGRLRRQTAPLAADARAPLFNRAGDLCVEAGDRRRALEYYGKAIDAYLEAGFSGPAAAMCRKVIRQYPDVVRAHCTLAFLAIGDEQFGDAEQAITAYTAAAKRTSTEILAVARLHLLSDVTTNVEVRRHIAERLDELGDVIGSDRILSTLADAEGGEPERTGFYATPLWSRLVHAAVLNPDELWRHA